MAKILLVFILFVHGLIHLMGFIKAFHIVKIEQLTQTISKPVGVLWGFTTVIFLIALIALLLDYDWWWLPGTSAVITSQVLIVMFWRDAKFGTIANIIILISLVVSFGVWKFNNMVDRELKEFHSDIVDKTEIVSEEMLSTLPAPVSTWLRRSGIVSKEIIQSVHLIQSGEMKTTPEGDWLPFTAEQYVKTEHPGFYWIADVQMAPMIHIAGRDKYNNGNGHMLIKLLSLIPVVEAEGETLDQGAMLRYLAEIIWYPTAALSNYITWQEIDSLSAKATMAYGGVSASAVFRYNIDGDVIEFEAKRYYDRKEGATLEDWLIQTDADSFKEFQGIRIPTRSTVTWKLEKGDYKWLQLSIDEVVYNRNMN